MKCEKSKIYKSQTNSKKKDEKKLSLETVTLARLSLEKRRAPPLFLISGLVALRNSTEKDNYFAFFFGFFNCVLKLKNDLRPRRRRSEAIYKIING